MTNYLQRSLLSGVVAAMLPAMAAEAAITAVSVEPRAQGTYELSWTSDTPGEAVNVYVANQPYVEEGERVLLLQGGTSGKENIQVASKGRPYFYVVGQDGKGQWSGERVLPLEGGRNFRDLGGYPAADGRRVKWGQVFRSGSMANLTAGDYDYLAGLRIQTICDFRTEAERTSEPNQWHKAANINYWARDYDMGFGEITPDFFKGVTPAQMREVMIEGYRQTPDQQAEAYREMFQRLLAGEIPLAFNCSAGKDRAGVAAAFVLSALGVPRDIIIEDYALSEKIVDFQKELVGGSKDGALGFLANLPPEIVAPMMRTEPSYIIATFDAVEKKYGSIERYFETALGISQNDLAQLRNRLLE